MVPINPSPATVSPSRTPAVSTTRPKPTITAWERSKLPSLSYRDISVLVPRSHSVQINSHEAREFGIRETPDSIRPEIVVISTSTLASGRSFKVRKHSQHYPTLLHSIHIAFNGEAKYGFRGNERKNPWLFHKTQLLEDRWTLKIFPSRVWPLLWTWANHISFYLHCRLGWRRCFHDPWREEHIDYQRVRNFSFAESRPFFLSPFSSSSTLVPQTIWWWLVSFFSVFLWTGFIFHRKNDSVVVDNLNWGLGLIFGLWTFSSNAIFFYRDYAYGDRYVSWSFFPLFSFSFLYFVVSIVHPTIYI